MKKISNFHDIKKSDLHLPIVFRLLKEVNVNYSLLPVHQECKLYRCIFKHRLGSYKPLELF